MAKKQLPCTHGNQEHNLHLTQSLFSFFPPHPEHFYGIKTQESAINR